MKILEEMLEVETKATQIIENAKLEANAIRVKAREDAKQLVVDGKKELQDRLLQELEQIEKDAAAQKELILKEIEITVENMERTAKERMDSTVDLVINTLLNR